MDNIENYSGVQSYTGQLSGLYLKVDLDQQLISWDNWQRIDILSNALLIAIMIFMIIYKLINKYA